ncbi:single-stranded DNA-binding protein [Deinococcus soli (ex Cha et al. 2016)]|uniref:single-stranded DNA-binding protein n=1 Tax=Deinococcus soli (ex Cha et al. 2016) TaxID=1309411 RepID=UPI0016661883|nr:single-stranded DNA-binding protein [Deinococcus soli (ex Cha et al. 2016)]GGB73890.1 single-stranded DNA-binding protein [Deinococcus soli (ex Cha et al. 2016)]
MRGVNALTVLAAVARVELRYTPGGTAVLEYTVAGERPEVRQGVLKSVPFYLPMVTLGKAAEALSDRLVKGAGVLVSGSLAQESWTDAEGGRQSKVIGKGLRVEFLAGGLDLVDDSVGGVRLRGGSALVQLGGNLTRDPEVRYTPAGDAVLELGVAVNEQWTDGRGDRQERVHFFEVVLWREEAEAFAKVGARKGMPVFVEGAAQSEAWTDREGRKRSTVKVTASRVTLLQGGGGAVRSEVPARALVGVAAGASGGVGRSAGRPAPGGVAAPQEVGDFPRVDEEDLPF